MYGDVDERRTAERKLEALRQTSSVAAYAATFQQYTPRIGWNNEALLAQFRLGLKPDIKDLLINQPTLPTNLSEYINLCIKLDQRVIERRWEKGSRASHPGANTARKRHETPRRNPNEMDWEFSATKGSPRKRTAHSTQGSLTPAQRKERIDKNLCLYCGKPGHKARECRAKEQPGPRMASTQVFAATSAPLKLGRLVQFEEPEEYRKPPRQPKREPKDVHPANTPKRMHRFRVMAREDDVIFITTFYWNEVWCNQSDCIQSAQHTHKAYNKEITYKRNELAVLRISDQREIASLWEEVTAWGNMEDRKSYEQLRMLYLAMDSSTFSAALGNEDSDEESGNEKAARN